MLATVTVFATIYVVLGIILNFSYSSILFRSPREKRPGELPSVQSHRVRHGKSNLATAAETGIILIIDN